MANGRSKFIIAVLVISILFLSVFSGRDEEHSTGKKPVLAEEMGTLPQTPAPNSTGDVQRRVPLVILVHDVSPVYREELEEILDIVSQYGLQKNTYLFIIPDHAGQNDLRENADFVGYLSSLREEGYHIGLHGYTHEGEEFNCTSEEAKAKLEKALKIMADVNLTPEYFLPPRYALSEEAKTIVLSHNLTIITRDSLLRPDGTEIAVTNREYTWYISPFKLPFKLREAKKDYMNTDGVFYLSIHPKAVNNWAGMEFLKRFLEFVIKESQESLLTAQL
ncbi:MAG: DUF2334 domain-containing protein [Thermococcus sp.]|nr:DUF2334 domain-containing protein [Thermococcus sp.]